MSIPGDTWKFYRADIDPATSLPMDNLTFAGGPATSTVYGKLHLRGQHRVYLWTVVSARDLGLISESRARARIRRP